MASHSDEGPPPPGGSITKYFDKLEIDPQVVTLGLDLVLHGARPGQQPYVMPHSKYPGGTIYLQICTSDVRAGRKGWVKLLPVNAEPVISLHQEPVLSPAMEGYYLLTYLKHNIRLDPKHLQLAQDSKKGLIPNFKFIVKALIIRGRGAITFAV